MSPQDSVERVLKEIHVAFSKSPTYNGQPDKMIVDRKEFLNLLDRLNRGIFDMMEQYEQTRQSRLNAERSFRKTGNEIIEKANASAEEIYAASVIYTSDAISRIRDLMDQTNESMDDLFRRFRREMRDQKNLLKSHETELEAQLADLADTKKYLAVLQEMNHEHEKRSRDSGAEGRTSGSRSRAGAAAVKIKVNEEYFEKTGRGHRDITDDSSAPAEKPDIKVNPNAAYFKWKEEQGKAKSGSGAEQPDSESTDGEADLPIENIRNEGESAGTDSVRAETDSGQDETSPVSTVSDRADQRITRPDNVVQKLREHGREAREEYYETVPVSSDRAKADASDEDFPIHPNPEFPDEESIYRALLEDEKEMEAVRQEETPRTKSSREFSDREKLGAGGVLKTILFGKE
ncbi:MAG: hypothetical protein LUF32_07440 [Clostridiales bacterium]|nr:hypothetical protein [Clostridiales bacterium]